MKPIKLLPFVYKVKGRKNWALYDLYNGTIFQVLPDGDAGELKKQLVELNLACETEGVIPIKFAMSMDDSKNFIKVTDLQIQVNGECNLSCSDCGSICRCRKFSGTIDSQVLSSIFKQFRYIPLEGVSIVGGNPLLRLDILESIKQNLSANRFCVMFNGDLDKTQHERLEKLGIEVAGFPYKKEKISEAEMKVDASSFFYNKVFNPCWGNKIAIDIDGAIKNCLWSVEVFGNICKDDLKRMLLTGVFDRTWEMNKDKIDVCGSCEYRYACPDCRAAVLCEKGTMTDKTLLCTYEP